MLSVLGNESLDGIGELTPVKFGLTLAYAVEGGKLCPRHGTFGSNYFKHLVAEDDVGRHTLRFCDGIA